MHACDQCLPYCYYSLLCWDPGIYVFNQYFLSLGFFILFASLYIIYILLLISKSFSYSAISTFIFAITPATFIKSFIISHTYTIALYSLLSFYRFFDFQSHHSSVHKHTFTRFCFHFILHVNDSYMRICHYTLLVCYRDISHASENYRSPSSSPYFRQFLSILHRLPHIPLN